MVCVEFRSCAERKRKFELKQNVLQLGAIVECVLVEKCQLAVLFESYLFQIGTIGKECRLCVFFIWLLHLKLQLTVTKSTSRFQN